MEFQFKTLQNGLRMVHIPSAGPVAHMAVYINAGTRDEDELQNGMAHFIEHTIFKGTRKRKSYHVLTRLESVGGELNAFTAKEETCLFATFLTEHFHRSLELVSDILLHPAFPEKEIKKEKDVILDEINSVKDNPSEEIYDLLEENVFKGHPLGRHILGTPEQIVNFTREDVLQFLKQHYTAGKMVFCTIGELDFNRIASQAAKYFEEAVAGQPVKARDPFSGYERFSLELPRNTFQAHCMLGNSAFDRQDPRRYPLFLLNNILGGPAMNSRLNMTVREKHGYAYTIESAYIPYTDTGIFSVYMGTDNENLEKSLVLVRREMEKLRSQKLGTLQLSQAKKQLIGQIGIANESNLNYMMSAGKAYLHDGRLEGSEEIRKKIDGITAEDILQVAGEIFDPDRMSLLLFKSNGHD